MTELSCPVCFEKYCVNGNAAPRTLPCGHSLCAACSRAAREGKLCPECRAPTNGCSAPNYALMELLTALAQAAVPVLGHNAAEGEGSAAVVALMRGWGVPVDDPSFLLDPTHLTPHSAVEVEDRYLEQPHYVPGWFRSQHVVVHVFKVSCSEGTGAQPGGVQGASAQHRSMLLALAASRPAGFVGVVAGCRWFGVVVRATESMLLTGEPGALL